MNNRNWKVSVSQKMSQGKLMKNWNNNLTYETASIIRVNQNSRTQDVTVCTYEDYEPGSALIWRNLSEIA